MKIPDTSQGRWIRKDGRIILLGVSPSSVARRTESFEIEALLRSATSAITPGFVPPPPSPMFTPPRPPGPPLPEPRPWCRICCVLEEKVLIDDDPQSWGDHRASGGIIYTGKAGFIDLAHVRDVSDATGFAYQEIHKNRGESGTVIPTPEGQARLTRKVEPQEWLEVAQSIAYDDAFAHEIWTYYVWQCGEQFAIPVPLTPLKVTGPSPVPGWGMHQSSFSPEDLPSNFLGTLVAARALLMRNPVAFIPDVEAQIQLLMKSLDAQNLSATRAAFSLIKGRWVSGSPDSKCYLKRRNLTPNPFKAGHKSDAPTPDFVIPNFSSSAKAAYQYDCQPHIEPPAPGGVCVRFPRTPVYHPFSKADFAREEGYIRKDAPVRYKDPRWDQAT